MTSKIEILEYQNQKILFLDLSNLNEEEILATHPDLKETAVRNKVNLMLLDTTNTRTTDRIKESSIDVNAFVEKHIGKIWIALIGLRGIQKFIANAISKELYFAKDREDGCRWLVSRSAN
jgi:hypothetical protein